MKKIILITLVFLSMSCKAQTPIYPLDGGNTNYGSVNGAYYKDINNFLDQYVGTWLYVNGNTSIKLVLQKKTMFKEIDGVQHFYTDYTVGEYQYIENGIEKLNTLNNLTVNYTSIYSYGLVGHGQTPNNVYPKCNVCLPNEKRLHANVFEPIIKNVEGLEAEITARQFVESGVQKLRIWFIQTAGSYGTMTDGQPTTITKHTIPYGEYILIKQ